MRTLLYLSAAALPIVKRQLVKVGEVERHLVILGVRRILNPPQSFAGPIAREMAWLWSVWQPY
jgi:hypothetical protein